VSIDNVKPPPWDDPSKPKLIRQAGIIGKKPKKKNDYGSRLKKKLDR
jgi:hypothetical protein